MIFISIFNFLEPSVTIIAQAIPMFRVLFVNSAARRGTYESPSKKYIISSPHSSSSSRQPGLASLSRGDRSIIVALEEWRPEPPPKPPKPGVVLHSEVWDGTPNSGSRLQPLHQLHARSDSAGIKGGVDEGSRWEQRYRERKVYDSMV